MVIEMKDLKELTEQKQIDKIEWINLKIDSLEEKNDVTILTRPKYHIRKRKYSMVVDIDGEGIPLKFLIKKKDEKGINHGVVGIISDIAILAGVGVIDLEEKVKRKMLERHIANEETLK